ncbi:MAG: bifunctional dihydroorotate dehydrogenase B NAD binding subunit/NADPH-dependent glutamate synthase [Ruminococcus sp.]|nr:bifunctional dihydroorotate dehydrogenase B NAD binding subunit/NADPH-dependent glutamate synthase [Ruminococcus sp.]
MYKILRKVVLNKSVVSMEFDAPFIAKKARAGQFIIFRIDEKGERVPLTISDYDREKGTITIIFQLVGKSTIQLAELNEGDSIADLVGPLGNPTEIDENVKRVAVIGGGVGCAIAFPQAKELHAAGVHVDVIAGFRTKDIVILENEFRAVSDTMTITTDDGTYGEKGFVTDSLKVLIESGAQLDAVIAIGPVIMMKNICEVTKAYGIKTIVSLNPIMIDGTGMCGGCRVKIGGETKYACVDGPDFDGHLVDFDELITRNRTYAREEREAKEHICNLLKMAEKPNMQEKKTPMPEQNPHIRARNFDEVALGYNEEMARLEAMRCLNCKTKPCVSGCPVKVRIPEFIQQVADGNFEKAYEIITDTNGLPAVCGRVCPQERQCESKCVRGVKGESVAIGRLERFVADYMMEHGKATVEKPKSNGRKVAVIGAGPAGLTCAADLAKLGYDVTIFEAFHVAGGVLMYGIPEFRLPKKIVQAEIEKLTNLGVKIMTNMVIGKVLSVDEIMNDMGFEAVFIGSGAGLPNFMGIEGESLVGVYSANEFLTRINLMKAYLDDYDTKVRRGKVVAVVGGGNVAMDAARSAMRLGAEKVYIIYRRSLEELPARAEEVHHAMEEGIEFLLLNNPVKILGDENGKVRAMECVKMELGEADESGRRSPVVVEGSNYELPVDSVIMAIGTSPNPLIRSTTKGLETNKRGCIVVDEKNLTTHEGVYAGGDAVTGAATVILAMGAGKTAAQSIDEYLKNK